jgi:hypothetical protein
MGHSFADQFSLLHFSVGVLAYFWNVPLIASVIAHALFEYAENTPLGIRLINRFLISRGYFSWPGEKRHADSLVNMIGDTVFFAVGWACAMGLDVVHRGAGS